MLFQKVLHRRRWVGIRSGAVLIPPRLVRFRALVGIGQGQLTIDFTG